jgi:NAD(P)-dependent dehydrogenase (short-subunit alcohol dehydrogenase family)
MTGSGGMLSGKVAVVTGAGRGIGRDTALMLAQHGARVVVNDLGVSLSGDGKDAGPADAVAAEIVAAGGEAVASGADVSNWDSASSIVDTAVRTFGTLDIVVNCAGIIKDSIFHKMPPEHFEAVVRVNLLGSFYISRAAAEVFREKSAGSYVHMTSTAGLIGSIGQANYAASKLGVVGLSRSIAMDMSRFGVRSNCIAPHAFSRMIESVPGSDPERQARKLEERKTRTRADQVAVLAAYLASDAAEGITGQIFGARGNEIYLYNQPRPIRSIHDGDGWTMESLTERLGPSFKATLTPLERTHDVISWPAI